jgi:hypothetical protein
LPDIRHRVGIAVPQGRVHETLAGKDGLAEFWTNHVEGRSDPLSPRLRNRVRIGFIEEHIDKSSNRGDQQLWQR